MAAAQAGWRIAKEQILDPQVQFVPLDEINIALCYDYLDIDEVVDFLLTQKPPMTHVCLTGLNTKPAIIEAADLVTKMALTQHPFRDGVKATGCPGRGRCDHPAARRRIAPRSAHAPSARSHRAGFRHPADGAAARWLHRLGPLLSALTRWNGHSARTIVNASAAEPISGGQGRTMSAQACGRNQVPCAGAALVLISIP